jgi:hypothetical protein
MQKQAYLSISERLKALEWLRHIDLFRGQTNGDNLEELRKPAVFVAFERFEPQKLGDGTVIYLATITLHLVQGNLLSTYDDADMQDAALTILDQRDELQALFHHWSDEEGIIGGLTQPTIVDNIRGDGFSVSRISYQARTHFSLSARPEPSRPWAST